jgi:hypothetical protein
MLIGTSDVIMYYAHESRQTGVDVPFFEQLASIKLESALLHTCSYYSFATSTTTPPPTTTDEQKKDQSTLLNNDQNRADQQQQQQEWCPQPIQIYSIHRCR